MLTSLRSAAGLCIARFRFRRSRDTVIRFTGSVSSAEQALVLLPFGERSPLPAPAVFEALRRRFAEPNITLIGEERMATLAAGIPGARFVRVGPDALTAFFLPRTAWMEQLGGRQYDLAIDLNLDSLLPSAYICRKSGARVRVGIERRKAERFYNLLIHPDPSLGTQRLYERLLACLEMF